MAGDVVLHGPDPSAGDVTVRHPPDFRPHLRAKRGVVSFKWQRDSYTLPVPAGMHGGNAESAGKATATLHRIATVVSAAPVALGGFLPHRRAWLQAHYLLNLQGHLAPRFRPGIRLIQVPENLEQATFACDRQVIDLHWLHSTGFRGFVDQDEFFTLLLEDAFSFKLAAAFASANVKADKKVEGWLALSENLQWQLGGLQTEAIRKRWTSIRFGDPRGTRGMRHVAAAFMGSGHPEERAKAEEIAMRWAVEKMLPHASSSERAHLFGKARGLRSSPQAHVFQRQQNAALKRVAQVMDAALGDHA